MRIIILVWLLMTSSIALAERMFDGFYASAGYTYFKNKIKAFESEAEFSEWVPKVSLGYGKSSKLIRDTNYRMYLGIDTFYIAKPETLRDTQLILEPEERSNFEDPEFDELEQQTTMGIGARVGLVDDSGELGGNVYIDLGYVETEMQGMGSATDGGRSLVIQRTSVDFKGSYWGIGYELAFPKDIALRMEFHNYDYNDEDLSVSVFDINGIPQRGRVLDALNLNNRSMFFGLTGRF